MQPLDIELALVERLENVDIVIADGSNTRLFDDDDRLRAGDSDHGQYPQFVTNAGGTTTAVVNTNGSYKYVGRLVIDFDEQGNIIPSSYDEDVSGAYATDTQGGRTSAPRAWSTQRSRRSPTRSRRRSSRPSRTSSASRTCSSTATGAGSTRPRTRTAYGRRRRTSAT